MAEPDPAHARRTTRQPEVHVVGTIDDFPAGAHRVVHIGRRQIGIFNIEGKLHGLPNICPHQAGPLCEGKRTTGTLTSRSETGWAFEWIHDGEIVACPWHGLEYHVPTGQCLAFPEIRLRQYEVFVDGSKVKVRV